MKQVGAVTNLALSKELKHLGVKQDSQFYWYYLEADHPTRPGTVSSTPKLVDRKYRDAAVHGNYEWGYAFTSAFTVAELGDVLVSLLKKQSGFDNV